MDPEQDALVEIVKRSRVLAVLRERSMERAEVEEALGVSRATSHRLTTACVEAGFAERQDGRYALTPLGALLAEATEQFAREAREATRLAPLLSAVPDADPRELLDAFSDAVVTEARPMDPYAPVSRFVALLRESESLRGLDSDAFAPLYIEEVMGRIAGGMDTEVVSLVDVTERVLREDGHRCAEACASGHLRVWLRDEVPLSLALLDDRVAVGLRDPRSRELRAVVDTDAPEARAWAEDVFERCRQDAARMPEFSWRGLRRALESMREA